MVVGSARLTVPVSLRHTRVSPAAQSPPACPATRFAVAASTGVPHVRIRRSRTGLVSHGAARPRSVRGHPRPPHRRAARRLGSRRGHPGGPAHRLPGRRPGARPHAGRLQSVTVSGFRGIGRTARLPLTPGPGLSLVTGRNGSGKSSFAEAVEIALTGDNARWRGRSDI
ncbi:AAA family ATPase [Streptomyces iakyrus]|uniref:AAA family ATPase n=1 Tax=Streptomyces iakyrus TaxID=68219 RepID=A0ABW8FN67_9ACTN